MLLRLLLELRLPLLLHAASAACLCSMLRSLLQLQRLHWEFEAHAGLLAMSTKKWLRRMRVMIMG